ncbi:NfeD family protein [Paenibacillus gansuensis]|uniref:Nodulation protein NfeD n=1 Tax=Paenibacillus gansuensis TaxID=306542 RepID=A0ABW5PC33_9BACL
MKTRQWKALATGRGSLLAVLLFLALCFLPMAAAAESPKADTADDRNVSAAWLSASGTDSKEAEQSLAEKVAAWVTHPAVMTLLFVIGLAGIAIELLVPGFGYPGILGTASFALYFFGHYIAGFAGVEEVVLFIAGIVLLASEIFVPSFGILGILGIVSLISGVVLAAQDSGNAAVSLGIAAVIALIITAVFVRYFRHRGVWHKFILKDELKTSEGYVPAAAKTGLLHQTGTSLTPLRPAGTIQVGGQRVDVVTEGEFIAAGKPVRIMKIEGSRVVVRETDK